MNKSIFLVPFAVVITSCQGLNDVNTNSAESEETFDDFNLDGVSVNNEVINTRGATQNQANQNTEIFFITFVNFDYSELYFTTVSSNQIPVYEGDVPKRPADSNYEYVFSGWSPAIAPANQNQTYVAQYTTIYKTKEYQITWKNYDGSILKVDTFAEGTTPFYSGPTPERKSDERLNYFFSGWDKELKTVDSDETYVAVFTPSTRLYKVTFYIDENTPIIEKYYEYEQMPSYGDNELIPTKESTQQYSYKFKGWDKEFTPVTDDQKYYAVFESSVRKYTVFFYSDSTKQNLLYSKEYEYGETPKYEGETPKKEKDEKYKYSFAGWNTEIKPVVENTEYYALYYQTERKMFKVWYCHPFASAIPIYDETTAQYPALECHLVENGEPLPEADYHYTFARDHVAYSGLNGSSGGLSYHVCFDVNGETARFNDQAILPGIFYVGFIGEKVNVVNRLRVIKNDGSTVGYYEYMNM